MQLRCTSAWDADKVAGATLLCGNCHEETTNASATERIWDRRHTSHRQQDQHSRSQIRMSTNGHEPTGVWRDIGQSGGWRWLSECDPFCYSHIPREPFRAFALCKCHRQQWRWTCVSVQKGGGQKAARASLPASFWIETNAQEKEPGKTRRNTAR